MSYHFHRLQKPKLGHLTEHPVKDQFQRTMARPFFINPVDERAQMLHRVLTPPTETEVIHWVSNNS